MDLFSNPDDSDATDDDLTVDPVVPRPEADTESAAAPEAAPEATAGAVALFSPDAASMIPNVGDDEGSGGDGLMLDNLAEVAGQAAVSERHLSRVAAGETSPRGKAPSKFPIGKLAKAPPHDSDDSSSDSDDSDDSSSSDSDDSDDSSDSDDSDDSGSDSDGEEGSDTGIDALRSTPCAGAQVLLVEQSSVMAGIEKLSMEPAAQVSSRFARGTELQALIRHRLTFRMLPKDMQFVREFLEDPIAGFPVMLKKRFSFENGASYDMRDLFVPNALKLCVLRHCPEGSWVLVADKQYDCPKFKDVLTALGDLGVEFVCCKQVECLDLPVVAGDDVPRMWPGFNDDIGEFIVGHRFGSLAEKPEPRRGKQRKLSPTEKTWADNEEAARAILRGGDDSDDDSDARNVLKCPGVVRRFDFSGDWGGEHGAGMDYSPCTYAGGSSVCVAGSVVDTANDPLGRHALKPRQAWAVSNAVAKAIIACDFKLFTTQGGCSACLKSGVCGDHDVLRALNPMVQCTDCDALLCVTCVPSAPFRKRWAIRPGQCEDDECKPFCAACAAKNSPKKQKTESSSSSAAAPVFEGLPEALQASSDMATKVKEQKDFVGQLEKSLSRCYELSGDGFFAAEKIVPFEKALNIAKENLDKLQEEARVIYSSLQATMRGNGKNKRKR